MTVAVFTLSLLLFGLLHLLVGTAFLGLVFPRSRERLPGDVRIIFGFMATPLILGILAYSLRIGLGTHLVLVAVAALGLTLRDAWKRRESGRPQGVEPSAAHPESGAIVAQPTAVPCASPWERITRGSPGRIFWFAALLAAGLLNVHYLLWALDIPYGADGVFQGTIITDFDKHLSNVVAVARDGLPAGHPYYPGLPLVYYTGFYTVPAALAALLPAHILQVTVAYFVLAAVVQIFVAYRVAAALVGSSAVLRWFAALVLTVGLTAGWRTVNLGETLQGIPGLHHFWRFPNHPNPLTILFAYLPQHLLAIGAATLCLLAVPEFPRVGLRPLACWIVLSAFVVCSSIMIGLLYLPIVAVQVVAGCWRARRSGLARVVARLVLTALCCAACCLPHYVTALRAVAREPGGSHAMFLWTDHAAHNVGFLILTCGLGLAGLLLAPTVFRDVAGLRAVYGLAVLSVGVALTGNYFSEMLHKSLALAQFALPVLLLAFLGRLAARARDMALPATMLLGINAGLSLWDGVIVARDHYQPQYTVLPKPVIELGRWARRHTRLADRLTVLDGERTDWNVLAARTAVVNYDRLLAERWTDQAAAPAYFRHRADVVGNLLDSDYVQIAYVPFDFHAVRRPIVGVETGREVLAVLGYEPVFENGAGLIARRAVRDAPAILAERVSLPRVRALVSHKMYATALAAMEAGRFSAGEMAELAYLRGFCLQSSKTDLPAALIAYDRALALGADRFWVLFHRGQLLADLGRVAEALADLEAASGIAPDHPGLADMVAALRARFRQPAGEAG